MKSLRRMAKLLPPAFIMRIWLNRRYGIKVPPAPGGTMARFFLAVLPYAFTAALSVRVKSDSRLIKYLLPYGRMKRFVRRKYAMQIGNDAKDRGAFGKLRAAMPYGLVLWWDAEDRRTARDAIASKQPVKKRQVGQPNPDLNFSWRISERERTEYQRMDRIEAMALRLCIMTEINDVAQKRKKENT